MITKYYSINTNADDKMVLLVNPPVYDVSDFKLEYCQPTGLLKIASLLKNANLCLIDALEDVTIRDIVSDYRFSDVHIPVYRYGLSFQEILEKILELPKPPDEVYISSFATYWYESTQDIISLIKSVYADAKIIVGGIYPTLMPEHAERHLHADTIVVGEVLNAGDSLIDLGLYRNAKYLGLKPTIGCPHDCGYCAQKAINGKSMRYEEINAVVSQIEYNFEKYDVDQVYIFSENFLFNKKYFQALLHEIIRRQLTIRIGAPKGMEPRLLDLETLLLMREAGWKGIRLALETIDEEQKALYNRRFNNQADYENAIFQAMKAGFDMSEIGTFLLYGLPDEKYDMVMKTAEYIYAMGGYIIPMAFTPVPGSRIYQQYRSVLLDKPLTSLRGRLYPFAEHNGLTLQDYLNLETVFATLNSKRLKSHGLPFDIDTLSDLYAGAFARSEISFAIGAA